MLRTVVSYDKDLPEIPDRAAHLPPEAYLRKLPSTEDFEVVEGRRPSKLLLINRLRERVGRWREDGYPGASEVTRRLFNYWFEEDHETGGKRFRYYFGQREALETLAYLVEVEKTRDAVPLVKRFGEVVYPDGAQHRLEEDVVFETTMAGRRKLRRYVPEQERSVDQDLPPEGLSRYAFKAATGSGKTVVMAMAAVWSHFHKRQVPGSPLSDNFLVVAPNVIVYQRLEKDFGAGRIFHELPLIPPEWRGRWALKVILRGEGTEPDPSGNFFLANVQHLAEREQDESVENAIQRLLGPAPLGDLSATERPMLARVKDLPDLVVMNDEAHHVHDEDLQWTRTLMDIHLSMPAGLGLWLDFSATPKDQNGTFFPWIVTDYPLAQAVEDRIVKAPLIVHRVEKEDPRSVTQANVAESYGDWLLAALTRWREHRETYEPLGSRPVLFVMAEKSAHADRIGQWLVENEETGLSEEDVLVIHTNTQGEVTQGDLEKARAAVRDIDRPESKIKVVVSVLMLREGWDVRNVTVILGLRPFTAAARILPEQAVGRGLRLMGGVSPDSTQTLEVMGTRAFEDFVRELETEGVGIKTVTKPPPPPVKIEPVREKQDKDIAIPMTKPSYERNYRNLDELAPTSLEPVYRREEVRGRSRITLRMEFATTETDVHEVEIVPEVLPDSRELLGRITRSVVSKARLAGEFARLYPLVREYCKKRAFSEDIDLDEETIRDHLRQPGVQEKISNYLAQEIGRITVEVRPLKFERRELKLSDTKEFAWRRNLPLATCQKTIFNLVATYNDYEKRVALFLEGAPDVDRFAALGTTEQESGSVFRVDYLKPSGAIGFYHPDFVVVQSLPEGEVNWIVETKGRVWEDTEAKDAAIIHWCEEVSAADPMGGRWRYVRVNQTLFDSRPFWASFTELTQASLPAKEAEDAGGTLLDAKEEEGPATEPSEGLPVEASGPEVTEEPEDGAQPPDPRAAAPTPAPRAPRAEPIPADTRRPQAVRPIHTEESDTAPAVQELPHTGRPAPVQRAAPADPFADGDDGDEVASAGLVRGFEPPADEPPAPRRAVRPAADTHAEPALSLPKSTPASTTPRLSPPQPVPRPAPRPAPAPVAVAGENDDAEEGGGELDMANYGWTEFWSWARSRGFTDRKSLDAVVGRPTNGMTPLEIRKQIQAKGQG